jgi:poly-gamma-glutamate capsule biosynthesis protein CapA/YwtB (metallophosphatase superfamily)
MSEGRAQVLLCEQDRDAPGLTVEQRRKIRRRINNRASAQRVRAKREQDLAIASAQARPARAPPSP